MVNTASLDANYCYLKVNSLIIKGLSNSRTTLTSPKFTASLCSDKGPSEAKGQLTASSHSFYPVLPLKGSQEK